MQSDRLSKCRGFRCGLVFGTFVFAASAAFGQPPLSTTPPAQNQNVALGTSLSFEQRVRFGGWLAHIGARYASAPEGPFAEFFREKYATFHRLNADTPASLADLVTSSGKGLKISISASQTTLASIAPLVRFGEWLAKHEKIDLVRLGFFVYAADQTTYSFAEDKELTALPLDDVLVAWFWNHGVATFSNTGSKSSKLELEGDLIGKNEYWQARHRENHKSDPFSRALLAAKADPDVTTVSNLVSFLDFDRVVTTLKSRHGEDWRSHTLLVDLPGRISTIASPLVAERLRISFERVLRKSSLAERQTAQPSWFLRLKNAWLGFESLHENVNEKVAGKVVILFDDLLTSGASVLAASYKMRMSPHPPKDIVIVTIGRSH